MDLGDKLDALVAEIQTISDPLEGAADATLFQKQLRAATSKVAEIRAQYMRMAWMQGYGLPEIGDACGIKRQRVEQIVKR